MSFEDDMIEYGFLDGNDYLDYLMNEADRIQKKQREQEAQWEMFEKYKYSPLEIEESSHREIADVDELFFDGYDKIEELEKQLRKLERIKKDWVIKLWINDNPQNAKLWETYFKGVSAFNNKQFTYGFTGKSCLDVYEEWKKWLGKYEEFEEFKTKSVKEWEELKNLTLAKYLICTLTGESYLDNFSDCNSNTGVYKKYKVFKLWLKDNEDLWNNYIIHKYTPLINFDRISNLTAWLDTFFFYDSFAVWKFKHPSLWKTKSKEWFHNDNLMFEWIRNNSEIWDKWNKENSIVRKEIYNKYKLIFSNDEVFNEKYYNSTIEDQLIAYCDVSFGWSISKEEELEDNFKDYKCTLYTDLDLLRLWIKKHVKEWKNWKYSYLWKKEYNTNRIWENSLNTKDYFETWCKLYPKKNENWLNNGYKHWLKCKKDLDIWFLWLYDGNSYAFYEWAKINIADWNKKMNNVMNYDLQSAYSDTYGVYGDERSFKHWMQCHSNIWDNQQSDVFNTLLRHKWRFNDDFKKTYKPTYKIDIKIKELKYLSQVGFKIFHEGFAIIELDNKYGFFNEEGEVITPIIYDKVLNYRNGFAFVCIIKDDICKDFGIEYAIKKESWGVVDKEGKVVVQPMYDKILNYQNGFAPVCIIKDEICKDFGLEYTNKTELWGVVDKKGYLIIKPIYNEIKQITDSYIVFKKDWQYGIIEIASGLEIIPQQYDDIRILNNGIWVACKRENNEYKWAVISQQGNVTPFKYSYIFNSDNDLTMVVENAIISNNNNGYQYGEWGYIDRNGNEIEPLVEFDSPLSFDMFWKKSNICDNIKRNNYELEK